MNHMQSLKFEHKLYASVKAKMEEMQQHNMSWIEVDLIKYIFVSWDFNTYLSYQLYDVGSISEESRWYPLPVPSNADVHLRVRILPA